jgi:ectoine hydroxylase-related dioxygenase (phytanoyl-CoA dioxygenase family)
MEDGKNDYLFDLRGFVVVENALSDAEVASLNDAVDDLPPFETLIDHLSWFEHAKRFVGGQDTFDTNHGPVYIDENFFQITSQGEETDIHSGGHKQTKRTQFRYHDREFHCSQINVLVAFNDIGPGDGATMAVPGSHKQNFEPPFFSDVKGETLEDVPCLPASGSISSLVSRVRVRRRCRDSDTDPVKLAA